MLFLKNKRITLVKGINHTFHNTNWRQPCDTCKKKKIKSVIFYFFFFFSLELVRFYALYQIKPHVPPFVPNLSHFLWVQILRSYSPGGIFNAFAYSQYFYYDQYPSLTAWTTRVSNPFWSPRLRTLASVYSGK